MSPALQEMSERVLITGIITAISLLITMWLGVDNIWIPVLAVVINTAKVWVASKFGDPNTGGFLSGSPEAIPAPVVAP